MLEHIVRNNETVYDILTIYNISIQELREHNLHITDFNNLHSGTKLKIPFINDSVNQILRSTESFVEDYYSKISEEMLNEIEGINFDNNDNIKKRIENLIQLLSDDIANDEVKVQLAKLKSEKTDIIKQLEEIRQKERETKTYDQIKNLCSVWKDMEFKEKQNVVEQLLDKIVVDGKTLKIYWNVSES